MLSTDRIAKRPRILEESERFVDKSREVIMSNNIVPFLFEDKEVRFVGNADKPEWVARDVAEVLGLSQPALAMAMSKMPTEWRGIKVIYTPGDDNPDGQEMATLFEPGLYQLIFRSNKPVAVRLRYWVFEVVLPEIRRTGGYGVEALQQENTELKAILSGLLDQVDTTNFHRSIKELKYVTGIRTIAHLQSKTLEYLTEGEDYVIDHGEIKYNNAVYHSLAVSHRSTDGIDCQQLPEIIVLNRDCFIRVVNKIKNTLLPKRRWLPLPYVQLSFDFKFGEKSE